MVETVPFGGQPTSLEVGLQMPSDPIFVSILKKRFFTALMIKKTAGGDRCRDKERKSLMILYFFSIKLGIFVLF